MKYFEGSRVWMWIALSALVVYGWNFWGTSVYGLDEVKNAWCAYEIQQRGDLTVPYFNGEYHDKPGLPYFFMQSAYFLFGVNAFSARIFSVLFGVGLVLVIYFFARHYCNTRAAGWAAFILIASLQMGMQFKMATPDPYLLFFLTVGFASFYHGFVQRSKWFLFLFYASIGFAFFAKGPVAVALPGLAIVLYLLASKQFTVASLKWLLNPIGILLFMTIGFTWYILSGISTHWDWPEYFFITHNLSRYSNTFEGHRGFPFDTIVILIAGLLPLSVFLPQAAVYAWKQRKAHPIFLFCLSVIAAFCGFFLFSKTMLPSYPAPAMPLAAIMLGAWIDKQVHSRAKSTGSLISMTVLFVLCVGLVVAGYLAMKYEPLVEYLATPLALTLAILPLTAGLGIVYLRRNSLYQSFACVLIGFLLVQGIVFGWLYPLADAQNPVVKSVPIIKQSGLPVAYFKRINPAFIFQLGQNIEKLSTPEEVNEFVNQHGKVIIISTHKMWEKAHIQGFTPIFEGKDLFETPETIVLSNQSHP